MKLLDKLKFADALALVIILGCGFLIFKHIDGEVKVFAGVVITYYFTRVAQVKKGSG